MAVDQLRNIRLSPDHLREFEVTLDYRLSDALNFFDNNRRLNLTFAAGVLNWQFQGEFEIAWQTQRGPNAASFFGVRPLIQHQQQQRILCLIRAADAHAAQVLVLTELCLVEEDLESIEKVFVLCEHLRLLVAGSYHTELTDGRKVNRCVTLVRTGSGDWASLVKWTHDKFSDFNYPLESPQGSELRRIPCFEEISIYPRGITLVAAKGQWVTTVICKDLLEDSFRSLVTDLGVALFFVPSMTMRTPSERGSLFPRFRGVHHVTRKDA